MIFVLLAVGGGLLAGLALGGSVRRLEGLRPRLGWLLALAVLTQLLAAVVTAGTAYAVVLVGSLLAAVGFLAANRDLAGRVLLGLGLGLNALVIVANGAMPVAQSAAASAGLRTGPLASDPRHAAAGPGTRLALLEDRIALPLPWQPQVLSAGDVLVAAGAGLMVAQAMRRRRSAPRPLLRGANRPPARPAYPQRLAQASSAAPIMPPR